MAYKTKLPVRKEKDLFDLPIDETATGESFEMKSNKDFYELPDSNTKAFENDNVFETKAEKDAKIFELPANENEDSSLFGTKEHEVYSDLNDELASEGKPITVISKDLLKIKANGKEYDINRSDLMAYQKNYHLENGMEVPISRYRKFGNIEGHFEALDQIGLDVRQTFAKIDEKLGGMSTLADEEY